MATFEALIRKRGTIKHRLTAFTRYFDALQAKLVNQSYLDEREVIEFQNRVDKLDQLEKLSCPDDQLDRQQDEWETFIDLYNKYLASAKQILNKCNNERTVTVNQNSGSNESSFDNDYNNLGTVKLPAINTPTFNCDFNNWLEFKDTFEALFHNNSTLSSIQKYHYLRSCLGPEALKIIESLEFAAHNYNDAWNLLCDRFDNSRLLVNNHLKCGGLRQLVDSVNKHLRTLKTLKLPTNEWDALIIFMVSQKLDKNTNREWEQSRTDKSLPTLTLFFEFLKNKADFLETIEMNMAYSVKSSSESMNKSKTRHHTFLAQHQRESTGVKCNLCKQNYLIYSCEKFLKSLRDGIKSKNCISVPIVYVLYILVKNVKQVFARCVLRSIVLCYTIKRNSKNKLVVKQCLGTLIIQDIRVLISHHLVVHQWFVQTVIKVVTSMFFYRLQLWELKISLVKFIMLKLSWIQEANVLLFQVSFNRN